MEDRASTLRAMQICRFCLDDNGSLTGIYDNDSKDGKYTIPLPLQIMACVAIEVFKNDGMPQLICNTCRNNTYQAYAFKSTCKKSDDALKLYLTTGNAGLLKAAGKSDYRFQIIKRKVPKEEDDIPVEMKKARTLGIATISQNTEQSDDYDDPIRSDSEHNIHDPIIELEIDQSQDEEQVQFHSEIVTDEEEHEVEAGEDHDYSDDKINPILKVPQVPTDVFPCPHCVRSFPLQQLLDLHMKNHDRERCYQCVQCSRKFFTKYDLGKHVQTHSDEKPFMCVVCKKSFARESLLHRHEKTHVDVPKYLCIQCDKTFLIRSDLDAHAEKHKKKRPFQCRICNKSFVFKQGLERHEISHSEEKPHKCNYCDASFISPIKLMRHITSHAGLRPYPCKLCGRTFLLSHHLTRHMRSHYSSKNESIGAHKCDICSMSFRRKDSLINHSTIHSMVNLKCVICYTSFDNAKQVMNHITTHLSGLPYPCDKCDYSFDTQDQLEEHEIKHAEMEYEEQIEQEVSKEENMKGENKDEPPEEEEEEEEDEEDGVVYENEESDGDVTEYTITNPENPEIVRRSKREPKIKNYAQFLKEELGSDIEDDLIPEEEPLEITPDSKEQRESFKPIIRIEGTKVYARKSSMERPKRLETKVTQANVIAQENINQRITTLENLGLTKQDVQALPNKQFVDMKIGDKTVRVQKLMMTKAEIEQMAREGKIEMKGDTILLKKTVLPASSVMNFNKPLPFRHTMETIIDDKPPLQPKPIVKKTYVRKTNLTNAPAKAASQSSEDDVQNNDQNDNLIS